MKHTIYFVRNAAWLFQILVLAGVTSCVEEYNVMPESEEVQILVVDGTIYSNRTCEFSFRRAVALNADKEEALEPLTSGWLYVIGSQGESYKGRATDRGTFVVDVKALNPEGEYCIKGQLDGFGTFHSQSMKPLDAPNITQLTFRQPRPDQVVDFLVSTDDPGKSTCFLWKYDECFELHTPLRASHYYDTDQHKFLPVTLRTSEGWREGHSYESYIATNDDFDGGALKDYCVYQLDHNNIRLQTTYRTELSQEAITLEEYEYRKAVQTQSTEMGGLFTPMPSDLPSNIISDAGHKTVGFVGVRGRVAKSVLYVSHTDVGNTYHYRDAEQFDYLKEAPTPEAMLEKGFVVFSYQPGLEEVKWTYPWCIDCRVYPWNASLECPDYWHPVFE